MCELFSYFFSDFVINGRSLWAAMNFNSQANSYEINNSMQREKNGDDHHNDGRNYHNDGRNDHNMIRDDHAMHGRYHEDHPQSFAAYSDKVKL